LKHYQPFFERARTYPRWPSRLAALTAVDLANQPVLHLPIFLPGPSLRRY
jgi:hypothetical protein